MELANLLEGERKLKIEKMEGMVSIYGLRLEKAQRSMKEVSDDPVTQSQELKIAWSRLDGEMKSNLALMRVKLNKPNDPVVIKTANHQAMITALAEAKARVDDFNQRISDRDGERLKVRTMFYQVLCADRAEAYTTHDAAIAPLNTQLESEMATAEELASRIRVNTTRLVELRRAQTGVDASVEAINKNLKGLGVDSFWITRKEGVDSCIALPGQLTLIQLLIP